MLTREKFVPERSQVPERLYHDVEEAVVLLCLVLEALKCRVIRVHLLLIVVPLHFATHLISINTVDSDRLLVGVNQL